MSDRLSQLQARVAKEGLDAYVVFSDYNRNYLSHFTGTSGAVLLAKGRPYFVTDSRYTAQAAKQVQGAPVVQHTKPLLSDLVERLKRSGARKIGFEAGHLTVIQHQWLAKAYPKATWMPTRQWVEDLRLIKDAGEVSAMRAAGRVTDRVFRHILPFIRPGVREDALAAEMEHEMRRQGAEGPSFETIVASGARSALPHGVASAKKVAKGDLIVFDFGCRLDGYCSDMTRTVCVGKPSAAQRKVYGIVQRAQAAGLAQAKPGKTTGSVDLASRRVISKAGYGPKFGHGTGHGVGREVHEEPRVGPKAATVLKPGMAITVEPGIYLEGRFGVRIEDLVIITAKGHENMYRTTHELITV